MELIELLVYTNLVMNIIMAVLWLILAFKVFIVDNVLKEILQRGPMPLPGQMPMNAQNLPPQPPVPTGKDKPHYFG